jgi:hypothetical protein
VFSPDEIDSRVLDAVGQPGCERTERQRGLSAPFSFGVLSGFLGFSERRIVQRRAGLIGRTGLSIVADLVEQLWAVVIPDQLAEEALLWSASVVAGIMGGNQWKCYR